MDTRTYGRLGEDAAARYLTDKGYHILDRNVYLGRAEIDIVAENDTFIVFAEVKTRRQMPNKANPFGRPSDAVDARKKEMLIKGCEAYCRLLASEKIPRIDVIEVYADPRTDDFRVLEIAVFENAVQKRGKFSRRKHTSHGNSCE